MFAPEICSQLLNTTDETETDRLILAASEFADSISLFLDWGQERLLQTPLQTLLCGKYAQRIAEHRGDMDSTAAAWRMQGQALRVLGRHAEAVEVLSIAAQVALLAGNVRLSAQLQIGAIDSMAWLGRFDEAIALGRKLEQTLLAEAAEEDAAKVLVNLGNQYFRRDMYVQALDCYERALEVLRRFGDPVAVARVQSNCANILTLINRVEEAFPLFDAARQVFLAHGLGSIAAMVDANDGWLQYISGKHAVAMALFLRAKKEFALRDQELEIAKCDADLADVYRELNLLPEARECYTQALPVFEKFALTYEQARAELGLAAVLASEYPDRALEGLMRAQSIFVTQKNPVMGAQVQLIRAYLYRALGQNDQAMAEARLAQRTLTRKKLQGWAAEAQFLIAEINLERGGDATRQMRTVVRTANRNMRGWLECRAQRALGQHFAQSDTPRALRHFRAGVNALEAVRTLIAPEDLHVAFSRDKLQIYEDLAHTLLRRGRKRDIREALDVVERSKSRLILERLQAAVEGTITSRSPDTDSVRAKLDSLRAELSRSYHRLHSFDEDNPRRRIGEKGTETLLPLEMAYRTALRDAELVNEADLPSSLGLTKVVAESALRKALRPDETLIEFYIVRGEVCAFVLSSAGLELRYGIALLEDVLFASRRLRYHLKKLEMADEYTKRHNTQLHQGIQEVLKRLFDLLLEPLSELVQTEKVVIVPHGILHGLPFHAFFDGAHYGLDRWEILYAPSAAIWYAGVQRAQTVRATPTPRLMEQDSLLIGVPSPGTERVAGEVQKIATLARRARVFEGDTATLKAFQQFAGQSALIHIATHALYRADNPLFSGLRFGYGWLLARDLYDIPLQCELATLSACHTGVAYVETGDELFGLIRGFLSAGARSLAASLWPADDAATATLMVTFYELLSRETSKAGALRAAQVQTRETYPHPYHWAAFALFGQRD